MLDYRILVVGDLYDNHIVRYVKNLKFQNPSVSIDVLSIKKNTDYCKDLDYCIDNYFWFNPKIINIRFIRGCQKVLQYNKLLKNISINHHYNVVNIHFPKVEYSFSVRYFKKVADKILLTPWGSDVYRIGKMGLHILKHLYSNADYVCNPNTRFGKDVREIFHLKKEQIANLSMGSETIDYITENKNNVSVAEARKDLSLKGDYFITCGYNAHVAQNHKAIIDGVAKFSNRYPRKISLIFPMTYPKNEGYVEEIKQYVNGKGINAYFFTDYLDLPTLFRLRQSTDMFIHVQNTDANAASVQEYLLLGKKVLNGEWLRYDNMEIDGVVPYTIVKDLNSISEAIQFALSEDIHITSKLCEYIESSGWKKWIIQWDLFLRHISRVTCR